MNKSLKPIIIVIIIGFLLGIFSFLFVYGPKTLNPTQINWTMNSNDLATHFLGWQFFRNDPWSWPLANTVSYAYPYGISISYSDSIPLLAFILKPFSSILPQNFQYFGLWTLLCFVLQGILAALILRLYTKNNFLISIGALFFIFSPIMIFRLYGHNALSGHWVILYALYLLLLALKKDVHISLIHWVLVNLLSLLIHPYLTLMTLIIYFGYEINDFIKNRILVNNLKRIVVVIIPLILIAFILGLFSPGTPNEAGGLGYASMNLNSLFNPMDWSKYFLKDLSLATGGQYEGFNYLGFGMLILLIGALFIVSKNILGEDKIDKQWLLKRLGIIFIIIFSLFVSLSNKITFFSHTLINLPLPNFIENLWSIFRSTGRLFWPVYYLIYIFVFAQLIEFFKGSKKLESGLFVLLMLAFVLQVGDTKADFFPRKFFTTETNMAYSDPLKSNFWSDAAKTYRHVIVLPPHLEFTSNKNFYLSFAYYAAKNKMTVNSGYFARGPYRQIEKYANDQIESLKSGNIQQDKLYIINDQKLFDEIKFRFDENTNVLLVDNFMVICAENNQIKESYNGDFERIN